MGPSPSSLSSTLLYLIDGKLIKGEDHVKTHVIYFFKRSQQYIPLLELEGIFGIA